MDEKNSSWGGGRGEVRVRNVQCTYLFNVYFLVTPLYIYNVAAHNIMDP